MQRVVDEAEARERFGELLRQIAETRASVVVERNGRPEVVVVPFAEYQRLRGGGAQPEHRTLLDRAHELIRAERAGRPPLPVDETIRDMREERDAQLLESVRGRQSGGEAGRPPQR